MDYNNKILNFKYKNFPIQLGNFIHYKPHEWNTNTHTAFSFQDKNGIFVIEASDDGIVGSYYEEWWLNGRFNDGTLSIGSLDIDEKKAREFFKKHEGEAYDYMNLVDMAIYWFTGKTNVRKTDNWICSEFIASLIKYSSKYDIIKDLGLPEDDYISPQDFAIWNKIKWEQNGIR